MYLALTVAQIMNLPLAVPGCRTLCPAGTVFPRVDVN